jgi:DNA mismatch endonuclease (patch repair protein)
MARVRGKNTTPELVVRQTVHALGYRFRLHRKDLPGTPDLVFPRRKAVVFVHGCFWHRHPGCRKASIPSSHTEFWADKFDRNVARDERNIDDLERAGWRVLTIWECETKAKDRADLVARLTSFLGP